MGKETEETQRKILELQKAIRGLEREGLQNTEAYNNLLSQQKDYQEKLKKESKNFVSNLKEGTKTIVQMNGGLRDIAQTFKDVANVYVSFGMLKNMTSMLKANKEINIELHRTLINSGKHGESLKAAKGAVFDLRKEYGATFEDAKAVVETLAQKQYVGNIKEAASASYQFARATGIDRSEIAQLTVDLQKMGKVSGKTTTAMYADLLKIQQANGLTKEGMKAVGNQIVKNAANMRAWGKSEADIRNMAAKTGLLVSQFEKVGISAQSAADLVDRLLNPENIEENIASYAALGISISDAINGEIDEGQITAGLKDFGNKLKEMGPIAGKAYAKAMGISYSDAIKATDIEDATAEAMTPTDKANEALNQLTENTKTWEEQLTDVQNKVEGWVQSLPGIFLGVAAIIQGILTKKADGIINIITNKIKGATEKSSTDIEKMFSGKSLKIADIYKANYQDILSYTDAQVGEESGRINKMLDDAFAKMSKSKKGKKWLEDELEGSKLLTNSLRQQQNIELERTNTAKVTLANVKSQLEALKGVTDLTDEQKNKKNELIDLQKSLEKEISIHEEQEEGLNKKIARSNELTRQMSTYLGIATGEGNNLSDSLNSANFDNAKAGAGDLKNKMGEVGDALSKASNSANFDSAKASADELKSKIEEISKIKPASTSEKEDTKKPSLKNTIFKKPSSGMEALAGLEERIKKEQQIIDKNIQIAKTLKEQEKEIISGNNLTGEQKHVLDSLKNARENITKEIANSQNTQKKYNLLLEDAKKVANDLAKEQNNVSKNKEMLQLLKQQEKSIRSSGKLTKEQ